MTDNDWMIYTAAEATGTNGSEDILQCEIDLKSEIANADPRFVEQAYAGNTLAGEEIAYSWRYDQLTFKIRGIKLKGGTRSGIHRAIVNSRQYLTIHQETSINGNWTVLDGTLHVNDKDVDVKVLMHSLSIIGIYKPKAKLDKTIRWFERNIYKGNWKSMQVQSIRDYRPEWTVENDIYAEQAPEFTRETELDEINEFIRSLRTRRLSGEEEEILKVIASNIEMMV